MSKIQKIAIAVSTVGAGLMAFASKVGAEILPVPSYADVVNSTTTGFGGSLLTDLLPWAGFLAVITIAGIGISALIHRAVSGFSKIAGGRRRGYRGRRRR